MNYNMFLLQFFPTAEESMDYYNQKRCIDGKGLVLPSQIVSLYHLLQNVHCYSYKIVKIADFLLSLVILRDMLNILSASWHTLTVKSNQVVGTDILWHPLFLL